MIPGDVVLAVFPLADGQQKRRPGLVLALVPPFDDPLVCGISASAERHVEGFDDWIGPADADYSTSGLKRPSLIRLGFLQALPPSLLLGVIGTVSEARIRKLRRRLAEYLKAGRADAPQNIGKVGAGMPLGLPRTLDEHLRKTVELIDSTLDRFIPSAETPPATIHKAVRHSLFAGGKRLRPILCLAAAEACGGSTENTLPAACAVECLHTYSLIHDDLPCMDDDDFRRGLPTCHKVFGEGIAVLAGDALQALAFELVAMTPPNDRFDVRDYVIELAATAGSRHLIGGQVMDLEGEGKMLPLADLRFVHESKTAALLTSAILLGAMSAAASDEQIAALKKFGFATGLAFQIIDDILDCTQTTEKLGKSAGKDLAAAKSTYPALIGLDASRDEARRLTTQAHDALAILGDSGQRLRQLADHLLQRKY